MSNSTTTRHQSIDANQWQYPESWKIFQLKDILDSLIDFRGRTPLKIGMSWGGGDIPALSANNVEMGRINLEKETYYGSEALYRKWMNKGDAEEGDILLTMEAPLGNVAQIPDTRKYILSQRTILLKTKRDKDLVLNGFLKHQLMSDSFQNLLRSYSTGTTATGIQQSKLLILPVVIPPSIEQQKIAHILDTIDNLITLTDRHIAKLKLAKAGLLHDLLTRGIDENGELRDPIVHPEHFKETGTAIGRIPKDWDVVTVGEKALISSGTTPLRENLKYWQNGTIPWIKTGEINYEIIRDSEEKVTLKALNETSLRLYPSGTVLMAMYGQGVTRGKVAILGIEATTNQACAAIIPDEECLLTNHLFSYLVYKYEQIRNIGHGSNQSNLNEKIISDFLLPLPSIKEQQQAATLLNLCDARISRKINYCEKLKLLKKGLMTDLLTGRVRVNLDLIEEG